MQIPQLPVSSAFLLATLLSLHGLRKRSLSPSGAAAAFAVGYITMSVPLSAFGFALIVFYLTGSRATKVGKALKHRLEEGHQDAGYRSAAQVFCNSLSSAIAAFLWSALYAPRSWAANALHVVNVDLGPKTPYDLNEWCPLTPPPAASWSRTLIFVTLGYVLPTEHARKVFMLRFTSMQTFRMLSRRHTCIGTRHSVPLSTYPNYHS